MLFEQDMHVLLIDIGRRREKVSSFFAADFTPHSVPETRRHLSVSLFARRVLDQVVGAIHAAGTTEKCE